jgi:peptidoglycan/xylan/chitin deacetylase (PgdA/CDA1 family)
MPILMYHSISDGPEHARNPYYWTRTKPAIFAEQMAFLHAQGYQAVTLKTGMDRLRAEIAEQTKTVVLTFDDGFRDFHTTAHTILCQYNFKATMFLPTAFIGETRRQFAPNASSRFTTLDSRLTPPDCLTWPEIRSLHQQGIEFGSHTVNHPELVKLDWPAIKSELTDSKAEIEQQLGTAVQSFAYPYAFPSANHAFVEMFTNLLKASQYNYSVTTQIGQVRSTNESLTLKRLPVNSADDPLLVGAKIRGAYDWIQNLQSTFKTLKQVSRSFKPTPVLVP